MRSEDCACGGVVVCADGEDVSLAVRRHNETPLHQRWRAGVDPYRLPRRLDERLPKDYREAS